MNNRLVRPTFMFYPVILLFMTNNTFRQHNTKQKHRREPIGVRKNDLIPLTMPVQWEPIVKPCIKPRKGLRG